MESVFQGTHHGSCITGAGVAEGSGRWGDVGELVEMETCGGKVACVGVDEGAEGVPGKIAVVFKLVLDGDNGVNDG